MTNESILDLLREAKDPDVLRDVVSLKYIESITVRDREVLINLSFPSLSTEHQEAILNACKVVLDEKLPNDFSYTFQTSVKINSSRGEHPGQLAQVKNLIAVASGKGGVGKSTLSVNMALALQKLGARVGILDADIYGPSVPMMLGLRGKEPEITRLEGKEGFKPLEVSGVQVMSIGFLVPEGQSTVWRGPIATRTFQQLLLDTHWGELDYLILDLPPGTGDIHLSMVQAVPVTGAVVVTTPQEVALADARKCVDMFIGPKVKVPILGVIENMSYFVPDDAPHKKYYIFGKEGGKRLAEEFEAPFLAEIPLTESGRQGGDEGKPFVLEEGHLVAGAVLECAQKLSRCIANRNVMRAATKIVQIIR